MSQFYLPHHCQEGKIVKHWDSIQEGIADTTSGRTIY
ncbi:hypothetical protein D8880_01590 [Streptococcus sanguinis]|nr:hypothetical protein D8880_01590 [Streptococcus sanguinis]RSI39426.1 hypothetical protein D8874_06840 [Streptococcus sanguinis]